MEFKEVIKTRFSCRKYSDKKVERKKLDAIPEAPGRNARKPLSDTVSRL